jgi:hypothetical protein
VDDYGVVTVSKPRINAIALGKDNSGRITVSFLYHSQFVEKVKIAKQLKYIPM